ncbi:sigma-70 family RNA polymerase sigma factor [Fictibacillus marinisediminis]|uniref:sigma-70 family RNA polymerase sigma factor n=1 Tax=Fictibacillus marinisediminis TaxID=2878389 RepID=UPI002003377F|nr:sigma-70 family RNA polymerase sigma factor [Fictibacillus marinisediminis]
MHNQQFNSMPVFETPVTKEELMEQIMKDYGKDVLYLCYTYVKEWNLAEDLAQDVFVKIYSKADTFRGEAKRKTWIYKIAVNHCKDYIKSAHYRYSVVTEKIQKYIKEPFLPLKIWLFIKMKNKPYISTFFGCR